MIIPEYHMAPDGGDYYEDGHVPIGIESFFQDIHNHLKKNTSKALNSHQEFFNNLIDIGNIYTYGFSFSDVDLIYIREICNKIDTKNVMWYLSDFNNISERQEFINKINFCGFVGRFGLYNMDNPYYPYKH